MGGSFFLRILVISAVLSLFFSQGFGRTFTIFEKEDSTFALEKISEKAREMIQVMDYEDPGANTNPRTGYLVSPPPNPSSRH